MTLSYRQVVEILVEENEVGKNHRGLEHDRGMPSRLQRAPHNLLFKEIVPSLVLQGNEGEDAEATPP